MAAASAVAALLGILAIACGTAQPGGMSGPTLSGRVNDDPQTTGVQSDDILARDAITRSSKVKHILVGWRDVEGKKDPRAEKRTKAEADQLALQLLDRVRKGEPIEVLMAEFSEDPGSNQSGDAYEVTADAQLVFEFKRLGLRLNVGEAGLVMTKFGWHIMKRVK